MALDWSLILPVALFALIAILFIIQLGPREIYPYKARNFLLTDAEFAFFEILEKALSPGQMIAPKVRLGDVIGCSDRDWDRGYGPRISAKHLDFVIIERRSSRILLALELDDASHRQKSRIERDKFLNAALDAAAVPLLRVPVARTYNAGELKQDIAEIIADYERQRRN